MQNRPQVDFQHGTTREANYWPVVRRVLHMCKSWAPQTQKRKQQTRRLVGRALGSEEQTNTELQKNPATATRLEGNRRPRHLHRPFLICPDDAPAEAPASGGAPPRPHLTCGPLRLLSVTSPRRDVARAPSFLVFFVPRPPPPLPQVLGGILLTSHKTRSRKGGGNPHSAFPLPDLLMASCCRCVALPAPDTPPASTLAAACRTADARSPPLCSSLHLRDGGERRALRSRVWSAEGIVLRVPGSSLLRLRLHRQSRQRGGGVAACLGALGEARIAGVEGEGELAASVGRGEGRRCSRAEVLAAAAVTAVLATGNRVLYKLALVPLRNYPFFLAQLATFGYVAVYFSILYFRYHTGIVTDKMLSLPKTPYIAVGFLEALGAVSGMAAGAVLSGASIPILSQTFLVWQLILSFIFLGRRYRFNQVLGCLLVSIGVMITIASGSGASISLGTAGIFWTFLMITSFLLQAADTVLKEIIFLDAAKKLKDGSVDLFVVNSFGSAFQALFICLLLPLLTRLWGIPLNQLPAYIKDGAACFLNIGSISHGCEGAPLLPVMFVLVNMAFNISLLHLLKISSAVASCLASTFAVPLAIYVFTLPLPYVGAPTPLPAGFMAGAAVLIAGLLLYSWKPSASNDMIITTTTTTIHHPIPRGQGG